MEVWLHVGTGKTGTSAVQVALARHRDSLAEAGLLYPIGLDDEAEALEGEITSGNAKWLGWLLTPRLRQPNFDAVVVERWIDAALERAGSRPLLLSSETLQSPDADACAPLLARLRARGRRVRVLYLVRHMLDHAVAGYAQGLKVGGRSERASGLPQFLERYESPFLRQLRNWGDILGGEGDLVCRLYDREREGDGLVRNLLRCIDPGLAAALPAEAAPPVVNRTPTGLELALLERIARDADLRRAAAAWTTRGVMNAAPAMPWPITVPEASFAAFARRNAPLVAEVNRRHFGDEPVLRLTSGRIPVGPPPAWDPEAALATGAAMLLGMAREAQKEVTRLRAELAAARRGA